MIQVNLYRVLALDGGSQTPTATVEQEMVSTPAPAQPQMATAEAGQDNDESLAFFKKLAED